MYIEAPVSDEDFNTVWRVPAAVTITETYCETTTGNSVLLDLSNDGVAINGAELSCTTSGTTDSSMGGDATAVDGAAVHVNLGSVTGAGEAVSICMEYTYD